jgi:hypothetical protein
MAVPQLIQWPLVTDKAGWDFIEVSTSATLTGVKNVLVSALPLDNDYYWDLTGATATFYWVRPYKVATPVNITGEYVGPLTGTWSLTSPEAVRRSAQISSNMDIMEYIPQYIDDTTTWILENYGNPLASKEFAYDSQLDTQEYYLDERNVLSISRIYKIDQNDLPPKNTDLVEFTDYTVNRRDGKITLLLPVLDDEGIATTFVVEYIPKIFYTLATAKAAWRTLAVVSRSTGDAATSDILREHKQFVNELTEMIKNRYGKSADYNPISLPAELGDFAE